jgi:glycosyltransferase involved in cell wall biosynthesis
MKVLHIVPSLGPRRGGPSHALPPMGRALLEQGVDVHVVTTNDNGPGLLDVPTGRWIDHQGVPTWFAPRWSPSVMAAREFIFSPGWACWLKREMRRYDLLHIHALFSYLPSQAMSLARQHQVPFVLRPLGLLEESSLQRKSWKKALFLAWRERRNVRAAAAVHFTSMREKEVSREVDGLCHWVVPLGVEIPPKLSEAGGKVRSQRGWAAGAPCLLFLSRWAPKKQLPLLLRALDSLRDRPWHLILAGGDWQELDWASQKILTAWEPERYWLPGFVQGLEKAELFAAADLFVLPSISENFGVAVAEALAAGVPTVLTRGVALAEEVARQAAGWICDPGETELRATLREALSDAVGRERRGAAAALLAARSFSWPAVGKQLVTRYEALLEGSRPCRMPQ